MTLHSQDDALLLGAKLVANAKQDLEAHFNKVREQVAHVASSWSGDGHTSFQNAMAAWDSSVRKVTGALDGFEQHLRATQRDFEESDETQRRAFVELNIDRLG